MINLNTKEQNVYFTSDLHWNHAREFIYKPRGYNSIEEHNEGVIQKWNEVVGSNDIVFHLGDIIFGMNSEENLKKLLNRLNFAKLFALPGNHISGYKQLKNSSINNVYEVRSGKEMLFLPNYVEIDVDGQFIVLCHYPLCSFNGQSHGATHCHGHSHSHLINTELGNLLYKMRIKDVGIECCPQPISFKKLKEEMNSKPIVSFDHHQS